MSSEILTDEQVDTLLDAILRASGSALANYTFQKTIEDMRAAVREVGKAAIEADRQQRDNEWKLAVDRELVIIGSTADSYDGPAEAVSDIIDWHVAVATDPKVNGQQYGEPVAWQYFDGTYWTTTIDPDGHAGAGRKIRPLYTAQQAFQLGFDCGKAYGEMPTTLSQEPVGYARKDQLNKVQRGWSHMCQIQPEPQQGTVAIYTDPQHAEPVQKEQSIADSFRNGVAKVLGLGSEGNRFADSYLLSLISDLVELENGFTVRDERRIAMRDTTRHLLYEHKDVFSSHPKKSDLRKHIKELDAENDRLCALLARYGRPATPSLEPSDELRSLSDRAYCQYKDQMSRPENKGVDYKLENNKFGAFELAAHSKAREYLGRHRAFSEALALLARYGSKS